MTSETKSSIIIWAISIGLAIPCSLGIMCLAMWISHQLSAGLTAIIVP